MIPPTLECARALRDAGIDTMAALNAGAGPALIGLSAEQAAELKYTFGRIMAEVVEQLINPATRAFPELEVDQSTWVHIARKIAAARCTPATDQEPDARFL